MNDYNMYTDIEFVHELLNMSYQDIASEIGVSRMTLNRWKKDDKKISYVQMSRFYNNVFEKGIKLNKIKEQFYREDYEDENSIILFHGSKTEIQGNISLDKSKINNDFGKGFYCGESLEQSAMFVSNYMNSSLYILRLNTSGLKSIEYRVDQEWMMTIAYFRGKLVDYRESAKVKELIKKLEGIDYIVAPIADNRMFEIIDNFIEGEITDKQCQHCLSATNLGKQYVLISQKAIDNVEVLSHCFLANKEKEYYINSRKEFINVNKDKVKLARKKYRGEGKYIEEILL